MRKLFVLLLTVFVASYAYGATKITDLTNDASPTTDDIVVTVNDPGGTPANRKVTIGNLLVDGLIPNDITINSASTADALSSNPTDCALGTFATTIAANGNLTCRTIVESYITDLTHTTDTNANTVCSGTTTYLDGEGNCDDISSVYEGTLTNEAGLESAVGGINVIVSTEIDAFSELDAITSDVTLSHSSRTETLHNKTIGTGNTVTINASDITDQNAGTDITADLEEETHASEHLADAADEIFAESLGTACSNGQVIKSDGDGTLSCGADNTGGGGSGSLTVKDSGSSAVSNAGTIDFRDGFFVVSDGDFGGEADITFVGSQVDYITISNTSAYATERALQAGAGISFDDNGANDKFVIIATLGGDISTSELASPTGNDTNVVTGTAGSTDDCAKWDANGDLVTSGAACGSGGATTDYGSITAVTSTTDAFAIGGTTSSATFYFDVGATTFTIAGTLTGTGSGVSDFDAFTVNNTFTLPNGASPTIDAVGEMALDTTITDHQALPTYFDGTDSFYVIAMTVSEFPATDNQIIKYDASTDHFFFEADAGGGGTANLVVDMSVQSFKIAGSFVTNGDASQGAGIDGGQGHWRLLFDDTTQEGAVYQFVMPNNYSSDPLLAVDYSMASATTGKVQFEAMIMCSSDGDSADVGTASFATIANSTETVPGTVGYPSTFDITLTDDSCAAGDMSWIHITRDPGVGGDASGDVEVIGVTLIYTGS